ncbi:MAG: hypothetical protein JO356_02165 [Acidobacteria bacterium]|nr:hypothetical protein [Acidobacteriota bacterium]
MLIQSKRLLKIAQNGSTNERDCQLLANWPSEVTSEITIVRPQDATALSADPLEAGSLYDSRNPLPGGYKES